jgi:hypothetical protein
VNKRLAQTHLVGHEEAPGGLRIEIQAMEDPIDRGPLEVLQPAESAGRCAISIMPVEHRERERRGQERHEVERVAGADGGIELGSRWRPERLELEVHPGDEQEVARGHAEARLDVGQELHRPEVVPACGRLPAALGTESFGYLVHVELRLHRSLLCVVADGEVSSPTT